MAESGRTHRVIPELEPRIHKMLSHPLRYGIVMILGEREACATELARALGEDRKRVSEQIEILARADLVEPVGTQSGPQGGVVHLYRAVDRYLLDAEEWAALPQVVKQAASGAMYGMLHSNAARSLETGAFDEIDERVIIRFPFWTTREGAEKVDEIMCRAYAEVAEVEKEGIGVDETPIRLITAWLSFPAAPGDAGRGE